MFSRWDKEDKDRRDLLSATSWLLGALLVTGHDAGGGPWWPGVLAAFALWAVSLWAQYGGRQTRRRRAA